MTSQNHRHLVTASANINAAPKSVYSIIADYRNGHPRIVPDAFSDITVEVETDLDSNGAITTFTVNPGPAPGTSEVTITTELPVRSGPRGALERLLTTRFLRPLQGKGAGSSGGLCGGKG